MLAGFLVVAGAQLALVAVPVLLLLTLLPEGAALRFGVPLCTATVSVMAYATWRALRTRRVEPAGVPVTRADAPAFWEMVDAAAAAGRVRSPDRVIVVAEATVAFSERTHLMGLIGGRRDLYVGLPLMQAWDNEVLGAAVAHELAHASPRLSRCAPLAYRGRRAVARIIPRISRRNAAGLVLRAYAAVYQRVDEPASRAQELNADRVAAEFAGTPAAVAWLRDAPAMQSLQRAFYAEYVGPGWRAGHAPDDVFGGFLRMLAARADEVTLLRRREPARPDEWDTHPPLPDRVAALTEPRTLAAAPPARGAEMPARGAEMPARPAEAPTGPAAAGGADEPVPAAVGPDGESIARPDGEAIARPDTPVSSEVAAGVNAAAGAGGAGAAGAGASGHGSALLSDGRELVPDLPGLGRALQAVAFPPRGRTVVDWDTFFGVARAAEMDREADAALGTLTRAAGTPIANAGDVLDLAAEGKLRAVAETVFPQMPAEETEDRIAELITMLLALAALRSGAARWRHSWTGAAELVAPDGGHLDLGAVAEMVADPTTVGAARERLAEMGIDPAAAAGNQGGVARAEVVGGVVNLVVDGSRTDLLIVDTGLLLVPGLPRSQNGSAKRRLARVAATADVTPGARFVPYADVSGAAQTRRTPKAYDFRLRDGGTLSLRAALDSDELPGGWAALDNAVAFLARTR